MKLELGERNSLYDALLDAVITDDKLEILSKLALGRRLNELGPPGVHDFLVLLVIETAESSDRVAQLILEARKINDDNVMLREVAGQLLPKLTVRIETPASAVPQLNGSELPAQVESIKVLPPTQAVTVRDEELKLVMEMPATPPHAAGEMSWADAADLESRMSHAVNSSNSTLVQAVVDEIIVRLHTTADPIPLRTCKWLLSLLRRSRLFVQMTQLADALIGAGANAPQIKRQYAQALIDQGHLSAAEAVLQTIKHDPDASPGEKFEARGLIGRIYKQRYLDYAASPISQTLLVRAINEYGSVYKLDPQNVWHGINLVALIARARRDKRSLELPDENTFAKEILATIEQRERDATEPLPAWDVAIRLEANLALNRYREAIEAASEYIHSFGTDSFEIGSTLRQLTEIWQLDNLKPPGSDILPTLQSAYLRRQGASLELNTSVIKEAATVTAVQEPAVVPESIVAADKLVTLNWYQKGLEQCNAVARIEKANGQAHGTGCLVNAADFFPGRSGVLFVTNEHIISKDPDIGSAILPEYARVNFQTIGRVFNIKEVVWSSSREDLDTTFVSLDGEPEVQPLTIHAKPIDATEYAQQVYIIGYGRDLELSMQDSQVLLANENFLRYRASTELGSGGSPVFETTNWEVVALHHARLSVAGIKGISELSEGISILAIQKATLAQ